MTFLEIQTAVQTRLIDLPTAVLDAIPSLINEAVKAAEQRHNFKTMEARADFVTVVDARAMTGTFPTDFKEYRGRPWYQEELGSIRLMHYAPDENSALMKYDASDVGEPKLLLPAPDALTVFPLPDGTSDYTDGEYRVRVPYWKYVAALAADGDTNWFTQNAEFYLINQATSDGFSIDWDEGRAKYWQGLADTKYAQMILKDKYEWLSTTDTLALNSGANGPYGGE